MEIFQDGELEEEMRKSDFQANTLSAVWQLFTSSYQEAIHSLTSPVRASYAVAELGPTRFTLDSASLPPHVSPESAVPVEIQREDLQLLNARGHTIECSFWTAVSSVAGSKPPPCVLYLHGMSSSRKECLYVRDRVLARGFSLFALDFSGSGLSEGEFLSFGHFEKDDVRAAVDFLFATSRAARVALWGRCVGGAAALLYLCESHEFEYTKLRLTTRDAGKLQLGQCKTTGEILCVRPARVFSFRVTSLNVQNGDMVVLSINGRMVKGLDVESCKELLHQKHHAGDVEVCGYVRQGSTATAAVSGDGKPCTTDPHSRPFVYALALDSTYGDMECVISDMLMEISKSAEKRDVSLPATMISAASKIISRSVRKTAGFSFRDISVVDSLHVLTQPRCLFVSASKVDFIRPEHTRALYDAYGGEKEWLPFEGVHDQNRPDHVVEAVCNHLESQWHDRK